MAETEHGIYFIEEIAEGIYKFYEQRNASIYLVKGKLEGTAVENHAGKGIEYSHKDWKVILPDKKA